MRHNTSGKPSAALKFGHWAGNRYRAFLRQEARFVLWLTGLGLPAAIARIAPWALRIVAALALLYVAFWLGLVLLGLVVLAHASSSTHDDEEDDWPIGEQADHKKNPGYDPNMYNDAPDHRFYDSRYDDD